MAPESTAPPSDHQRFPGYCSFCRKSYREVGPLAEGPDEVFICHQCVLLCKDLIEQELHRRGTASPSVSREQPLTNPQLPRR